MEDKITINAQSSIKIEDEYIIYFDPFKIEQKTNDADIIFITHDHYDHFDISSMNNIIKNSTILIAPKILNDKIIETEIKNEIIYVEPNKKYKILKYEFKTIPSYNIDKQFHPKDKEYVGYIITINNERLYVAGDTDITKDNKKVKCDIALIPIGGTYTMDYKEAAELINIIKPKIVIPTHYNSVVGSLEDGFNFKKLVDKNIECKLIIK